MNEIPTQQIEPIAVPDTQQVQETPQESESSLDSEQIIKNYSQAISTEARLRYHILPRSHPASTELNRILSRLTDDPDVRVHIVLSARAGDVPLAMALPNKEIYVSAEYLQTIQYEEEVAALLKHKLGHIEKGHIDELVIGSVQDNNPLAIMARTRTDELEADLGMLIGLDERGFNPLGALKLFDGLQAYEQRRLNKRGMDPADPTHGSSLTRQSTLRETMRFIDLPNLSQTLEPSRFRDLIAEPSQEGAQASREHLSNLESEEFWREVKWTDGNAITNHIRKCIPECSENTLHAITTFLFRREDSAAQGGFAELIEGRYLDRMGLKLTPESLVQLCKLGMAELFAQDSTSVAQVAKIFRESILGTFEGAFSQDLNFVSIVDTEIVTQFVEHRLQVAPLEYTFSKIAFNDLDELKMASYMDDNSGTIAKIIVGDTSNAGSIFIPGQLQEFIENAGCQLPDIKLVFDVICKKAKIDAAGLIAKSPTEEQYEPEQDDLVIDSESTARLMRYYDLLGSTFLPVAESLIAQADEDHTAGIGKLHKLKLLLNRSLDLPERVRDLKAPDGSPAGRTIAKGADGAFYAEATGLFTETELSGRFSEYLDRIIQAMKDPEWLLSELREWEGLGSDPAANNQLVSSLFNFLELNRLRQVEDFDLELESTASTLDKVMNLSKDLNLTEAKYFVLSEVFRTEKNAFLYNVDLILDHLKGNPQECADLISFLEQAVAFKNDRKLGSAWQFGRKEKSQLRSISRLNKREALSRFADSDGAAILKASPKVIEEWPILWTSIDKEEYDQAWGALSSGVSRELASSVADETPERLEQILCLTFLGQSSWSSISLASALFSQIIRRCDSFDTALGYLKKYDHVPLSLLQPGLEILVEEKAKSDAELCTLQGWMREQIDAASETGDALLTAEASQILSPYIDEKNRKDLLVGMLTTNRSDEKFKKYFAQKWYATMPNEFTTEDIFNITQLAHMGELKGDSRLARAAVEVGNPPRDLMSSGYVAFDDLYQSLFQVNSVTKYLFLRNMVLDRPNGVFRNPAAKQDLLNNLLSHYTQSGGTAEEVHESMRSVSESVSEAVSPEDLYYFVGPFLAGIALQTPANSYPTTGVARDLFAPVLREVVKRYPEVKNRDKSQNTQALIAARLRTMLTGQVPKVTYNGPGKNVEIRWPSGAGKHRNIEDELVMGRYADLLPKTPEIGDQLTPLDLAIRLGEQAGSLGVRWLQMVGLYFDFSPEEREKINHVFDRVQGQNKLTAYQVIQREAGKHPEMRELADSVQSYNGMLGGGSIVTVYDVRDKDGLDWAVGVKNPNAEYRAEELKSVLQAVLEDLKGRMPENQFVELSQSLLEDAYQWIECEIEDEKYIEKTQRFSEQNDYRSSAENAFRPASGIDWKIRVPAIKDTGTNWVRWEELVRGRNLSQYRVVDTETGVEGELSRDDAKSAAATITQNFLYQLFENGLVHSDVHPGNFMLTPEREAAILDRKNLLEFNAEEQAFLLDVITTGAFQGGVRNLVEKFVSFFGVQDQGTDTQEVSRKIIEAIQTETNLSPENLISKILMLFKQEGQAVPLKWTLLVKNFLGLNRIAQWAGFEHFFEAMVFSPDGQDMTEIMKQVLPKTSEAFSL